MRFGLFYELQLPKPWTEDSEQRLFNEALDQVELADKLGIDYAWAVEHHFLDEYSHCSAPEVFLAAAAGRTKNIRLGHGIRQVIANYNHPARTAECVSTLDLVSNGRVDLGIGEGATRTELHGFDIQAKKKRGMSLEAAEQIANMMTMTPYPGYQGESFSLPCRNVLPKPVQKPHPPMWIACTNRDTIKLAASLGIGALAFAFVDPDEAKTWSKIYYDIVKSEQCIPIGHRVNANIAMVSSFSIHKDRAEAIRRGQEGFEFFAYALQALVAKDSIPGRSRLWDQFQEERGDKTEQIVRGLTSPTAGAPEQAPGIGTPQDFIGHIKSFQQSGVDQIILMQQAGKNSHADICDSLKLFGQEVLPEFTKDRQQREQEKAEELAPYIKAALNRKQKMPPLQDHEIPIVLASAEKARINQG